MSGQKHLHAAQDRVWLNDRTVRQQQAQRDRIDLRLDEATREQRFDLRCEDQTTTNARVKQRLDAELIAGEQQSLASGAFVVNRERKHAAHAQQEVVAVMLVHAKNDFGVGGRAKRVTKLFEEGALFAEVVELAVVDDADLIVGRRHRLVSGVTDVKDRKPRHAERDVLIFEYATVVGATMMQRADHGSHLITSLTPHSADP